MKNIVGLIQVQLRLYSNYVPNHAKKIKPGYYKAKPTQKRKKDDLLTKMTNNSKMEKELYNEFQATGELQEPDASQLGNVYYEYQRDKKRLDFKLKQGQMFRKHFKEYVHKDPSVLTYAEKENIRYLHKSDPDHWTPEKIAESFPITPEGAANLVTCKFSTKSMKEIIKHDLGVAKNIKLVNEGVIKLSADLAKKMTMREKAPITIGAYPYNQSNLPVSTTRSKCGEFESLVAPPNSTSKSFTATKVVSSSVEFDETEELMTEMRNPKKNEELLKLNIAPNKYMTLNEFETKVKTSIKMDSSITDPQLDYLLSLDDKTLLDSNVSKASGDMWADESIYGNNGRIRKYKNSDSDDNIIDEFGDPALLSTADSPITLLDDASGPTVEKIEIPENIRKPGAMYKVRDCYFDESGEFLYRVI